jgi:hypothetical protein
MREYKTPLDKRTATKVTDTEDTVTVRYHQTNVFHFERSSGVVTLDNGGYSTPTTVNRINESLTEYADIFRVYVGVRQRQMRLFVIDQQTHERSEHPFERGTKIMPRVGLIAYPNGTEIAF